MKKLLLVAGIVGSLFASTLEQRVEALEKRVTALENRLNQTENVQKTIVKKQQTIAKTQKVLVSEPRIMTCGKVKIVGFNYKSEDVGLDKGYALTFNIKNEYNKTVKGVDIMIGMVDNDDDTLVKEHLIKDNLNIAPKNVEVVKDTYIITDDMGKYLATTPKNQIKLDVKPLKVVFSDGSKVKCDRW